LKLLFYAAGSNRGSLNGSARTIMAQAMRAILLASATAATLIGRRSIIRASQSRRVPCCRAWLRPSESRRLLSFPEFSSKPPIMNIIGSKFLRSGIGQRNDALHFISFLAKA
jgi:hypothetical protein